MTITILVAIICAHNGVLYVADLADWQIPVVASRRLHSAGLIAALRPYSPIEPAFPSSWYGGIPMCAGGGCDNGSPLWQKNGNPAPGCPVGPSPIFPAWKANNKKILIQRSSSSTHENCNLLCPAWFCSNWFRRNSWRARMSKPEILFRSGENKLRFPPSARPTLSTRSRRDLASCAVF